MMNRIASLMTFIIMVSVFQNAEARDYRNKLIGDYPAERSFDLRNYTGQSLLNFLKNSPESDDEFYDAMKAASDTRWSRDNLKSIAQGKGVELRLADDISTIHVNYKRAGQDKADKSGRSFGIYDNFEVRHGEKADYIADASYSFYLKTLERALRDVEQSGLFYIAILKILVDSDPSGLSALTPEMKKTAADFVAVYVAEQYRRLTKTDGLKLPNSQRWDNAHLQTTLLANFHAGQDDEIAGMFYQGKYQTEIYVQKQKNEEGLVICAYKHQGELPRGLKKRDFDLDDYWQFFHPNCGEKANSGVNVTRRDFEKLGRAISTWLDQKIDMDEKSDGILAASRGRIRTDKNAFKAIANFIINERAAPSMENSDELVNYLVNYLMTARQYANPITADIMKLSTRRKKER